MDQLTRTTDTTGTTKAQQIGQAKHSGGGTATLERTQAQTFGDAEAYYAKARAILSDKSGAAGFDPSTTAVGAVLLGCEAVLSGLQQLEARLNQQQQGATAWAGNATVGGKT